MKHFIALAMTLFLSWSVYAKPEILGSKEDVVKLINSGLPDPNNQARRLPVIGFMVRMISFGDNDLDWFVNGHARYAGTTTFVQFSDYKSLADVDAFYKLQLPEFINRNTAWGSVFLTKPTSPIVQNEMLSRFVRMIKDGGFVGSAGYKSSTINHTFFIEVSRGAELAKGVSVLSLQDQAKYELTMGRYKLLIFTQDQLKTILGCEKELDPEAKRIWDLIVDASSN